MKLTPILAFIILLPLTGMAQEPAKRKRARLSRSELKRIESEIEKDSVLEKKYRDLAFYYRQQYVPRKFPEKKESIRFEGYADAYYGWYSDHEPLGKNQAFPTSASVANEFRVNMIMGSVKYEHNRSRATVTLHYGDIPSCAWSGTYNFIQEAHIGLQLMPKLWIDAGFFRTHLGFESIQPRENLTENVGVTTFFEPYFLSGAKLTWYISHKVNIMAGAFNGFNNFADNNSDKTFGLSANFDLTDKFFISANTLYGNEMPEGTARKMRLYSDVYAGYKSRRFDFVAEVNYGMQEKSKTEDSTQSASMYSGMVAMKYKTRNQHFSVYTKGEYFFDPDEVLTGKLLNHEMQQIGLETWGVTFGVEFKPMPNSFLRLEGRAIDAFGRKNDVFVMGAQGTNRRYEVITALGVWF